MQSFDDDATVARFCRTTTNPALARFIIKHPIGTEFTNGVYTYHGSTAVYSVRGYRCYWAGVQKNGMAWDRDTLIVVDTDDHTHTVQYTERDKK